MGWEQPRTSATSVCVSPSARRRSEIRTPSSSRNLLSTNTATWVDCTAEISMGLLNAPI